MQQSLLVTNARMKEKLRQVQRDTVYVMAGHELLKYNLFYLWRNIARDSKTKDKLQAFREAHLKEIGLLFLKEIHLLNHKN